MFSVTRASPASRAGWCHGRTNPPAGPQVGTSTGPTLPVISACTTTAIQIRFAAVFVFYAAGALLLLRRLPARARPDVGRAARAVGLGSGGRDPGGDRLHSLADRGPGARQLPLPAAAGVPISSAGRQIVVPVALAAAAWTVLVARLALQGRRARTARGAFRRGPPCWPPPPEPQ